MTAASRWLYVTHLVGNALLLWLGYYWLGVGESTAARLLWSGLLSFIIVCGALWLHGAGFAHFRFPDRSAIRPAFRAALAHLPALFLVAILALVIYGLLEWWRDYSSQPALKIASYFTLKTRKPVKPASVQALFNGLLWVVRWLVIPVILLPLASAVAAKGWHGFRGESRGVRRKPLYWIEVVALLLIGIWLPLKLIVWVPGLQSFGLQMVSFVFRLLIAYLLFTAAFLSLEFFSSGGSPRVSQVKTASAP